MEIRLLDGDDKSHCLTASGQVKGNLSTDYICAAMRGRESACLTPRRTEYGKQIRKSMKQVRFLSRERISNSLNHVLIVRRIALQLSKRII